LGLLVHALTQDHLEQLFLVQYEFLEAAKWNFVLLQFEVALRVVAVLHFAFNQPRVAFVQQTVFVHLLKGLLLERGNVGSHLNQELIEAKQVLLLVVVQHDVVVVLDENLAFGDEEQRLYKGVFLPDSAAHFERALVVKLFHTVLR